MSKNEIPLALKEPQFMTFGETKEFAKACYESEIFTDVKSEAAALVKIVAGRELGVSPIFAINQLYIVKGKIGMGVQLMGALLQRDGFEWQWAFDNEDNPTSCEITFIKNGQKIHVSRFTEADARKAGLIKEDKPDSAWMSYRGDLLFARAFAKGGRKIDPRALAGMGYTREELESAVGRFEEISPAGGQEKKLLSIETETKPAPSPAVPTDKPKEKPHWCEKHNTAFFKTGKMRWYAHPIKGEFDEKGKQKWCHEPKQEQTPKTATIEPLAEIKKSPIDLGWLQDSLRILQRAKLIGWEKNSDVIALLQKQYSVTANSVSGAIMELTQEQASEFIDYVDKALSSVKEKE